MTAASYAAYGKQVLRDGQPFADAVSVEAAMLITVSLGGPPANQLERDAIATGLRATALLQCQIAEGLTDPRNGALRKTFIDAASLMLKAAKELSPHA